MQSPAFTSSTTFLSKNKSKLAQISTRRPRYTTITTTKCIILDPNKSLTEQQLNEWQQVSTLLTSLDSSLQQLQADKLVSRAFGWGTQKFWRGNVKHEAPSLEYAQTSIQFLRDNLEFDDDSISQIIKKFPEVLRLNLSRMTQNVNKIQSDFPNIKGTLLQNSVKANPAVLGYDFDCEGDCKSECARCWVQF